MSIPRFISFDGADGVGKTTQLNKVADALRGLGYNVKVTKALGGDGTDFVQNELRKLLLSPEFPADDMESEERLFAIADLRNLQAMSQFLAESSSNIVITDRGIASHIVYPAAKGATADQLDSFLGNLYQKYNELAAEYGGLNIIMVPEDAQLAMDRVKSRGATITPRLENLEMQAKVIAGMKQFDVQNEMALGGQFGLINVYEFVSDAFTNVVISVGRTDSIDDVYNNVATSVNEVFDVE